MTIALDDLHGLYLSRKADAGPLAEVMRQVRDLYNGDIAVPLPELEKNERSAVANLMAQGLDQMGDRVASTVPDVVYPTRRAGKVEEVRSRNKRKANLGWWDRSFLGLELYQRGRHLLGYGTTPVRICPHFGDRHDPVAHPRWEVRDPLATYPGATVSGSPNDPRVLDCIFAVKRSLKWLRRRYDVDLLAKPHDCAGDALFEVIEYIDDDEHVLAVIGRDDDDPNASIYGAAPRGPGHKIIELSRYENRAGVCTAVSPGRINLERRKGQFDGMIGMYQAQARLFALEMIAVEQGVFPDEWLVARPNEIPKVVQVADGRRGIVGMIQGGDLRQQNRQPGQMTYPTIDRLERGQRLTAGIPAEFGGESTTNVRTGRRGENIMAATIDFTLLQAHRVLQTSMQHENAVAIAVDKGYHDTSKSFYCGWAKAKGAVEYKPSELFDTDENLVSYAQAGTDVQGLVVSGGQRVGMGTLSKRSFMEMDPLIEDAESELDRIVSETVEQALGAGFLQQVTAGAVPVGDAARIAQLVRDDKMDLAAAIEKVQREAQERQAQMVEAQSPEAQPGLAQPGMGAEATAIPEKPMPSVDNLAQLLGSLRRPQALASPNEGPRPEAMVG